MSDLRERLIAKALMVELPFIERAWPIIEAELQKRDRDHFDALVATESECLEETERLAGKLTEANKLLEQTIEVLEGAPVWGAQLPGWYRNKAKPLLDNLKALKKEGTE